MAFDVIVSLEKPVALSRLFDAWVDAFPGCVCGDVPRNSPETNPLWDEMPAVLKSALSAMPDQIGMSCEEPDGSIELFARKSEMISELIGEIRGRYDWTPQLTRLCRRLNAEVRASLDGSVIAPAEEES